MRTAMPKSRGHLFGSLLLAFVLTTTTVSASSCRKSGVAQSNPWTDDTAPAQDGSHVSGYASAAAPGPFDTNTWVGAKSKAVYDDNAAWPSASSVGDYGGSEKSAGHGSSNWLGVSTSSRKEPAHTSSSVVYVTKSSSSKSSSVPSVASTSRSYSRNGFSAPAGCTVIWGKQSVPSVPTTTTVTTLTQTTTLVNTPTVTVTASGSTLTASVTTTLIVSISASQATDTLTTTVTQTSLTTSSADTVIVSVVVTSTTSSVVNLVSTVAAPAGFLPVESTLPGIEISEKKRDLKDVKRDARRDAMVVREEASEPVERDISERDPPHANFLDGVINDEYAISVVCASTVRETVTASATASALASAITTTTTAAAVTTTVVISSTSTSVIPVGDASATVTQTVTSVSTAVITPTATSTSTSVTTSVTTSYTSTVYAACQTSGSGSPSNNLVYSVNTAGISFWNLNSGPGGVTYPSTNTNDAYDCCVACITNPACAVAGFLSDVGCYTMIVNDASTCTAPSTYSAYVNLDVPGSGIDDGDYVISNGVCGQFTVIE